MSLQAAIGAILVLGGSLAEARPIAVELAGTTAFDATQLTEALAVRLPEAGDPVRVQITPTTGGVIVAIDGEERTVALGDSRGPDAARLVALAATDLVLVDLAVAPADAPGVTAISPPSLTRPVRARRLTIGVLGGAAPAWNGTLGSLALDVAVPRGRWIATLEVGGASLIGGPIGVTGAVIRLGGGLRTSRVDLRAGPVAVPIFVSEGDGDRTVLLGGGASARLRLPIVPGIGAVIAVGVDAFATRTEYSLHGEMIGATPWLSPWLSAGVEVTP